MSFLDGLSFISTSLKAKQGKQFSESSAFGHESSFEGIVARVLARQDWSVLFEA